MSPSRRSSGEVNILAMLDGLGSRPPARRTLLWSGMGGALACTLVGALVWMAHDTAPVTAQPAIAVALPASAVSQAALPAPDPAPAVLPAAAGGATIVNLPTLSSGDAKPALAAAPPLPPEAPHAAPLLAPAPKHVPASTPRTMPVRQAGRSSVAAVRGTAHPASKRHAGAGRTAPAADGADTDVALISAIIQHGANRRDGGEDGGCSDKPCAPHTPVRP